MAQARCGAGWHPTATPTAGALAQARRRVGVAPLRWLFDLEQEVYALLLTYQLLRTAMADTTATQPEIDPDRASYRATLSIDILASQSP